jgi:hypothetical protein
MEALEYLFEIEIRLNKKIILHNIPNPNPSNISHTTPSLNLSSKTKRSSEIILELRLKNRFELKN